MSGDVINFQAARLVRREVEAQNDERTDLEASADLAIWIHDVIVRGLRSGQFSHHEQGPCVSLADQLLRTIGSNFVPVAEGHFHRVYGRDPYMFLVNLTKP